MSQSRQRLIHCFRAVFPTLSDAEIEKASSARNGAWDSVAGVTLIAVVEEEFGARFEAGDLEALNSFRAFQEALGRGD